MTTSAWRIDHDGCVPEELAAEVGRLVERDEQRWSRFRPASELSLPNARAGAWTPVAGDARAARRERPLARGTHLVAVEGRPRGCRCVRDRAPRPRAGGCACDADVLATVLALRPERVGEIAAPAQVERDGVVRANAAWEALRASTTPA